MILIGATTENPYFEVNGALISRSIIFELKPLTKEDIKVLLKRAVYDETKGMGSYQADISEDAMEFLAELSGGDARHALNAIELGIMTTQRSEDGKIHITLEVAQECIQKRVIRYDKTGDNHYDTISAFIKSMRGSDPDAAVYYLARMLYAGESVTFIARRIMICAAEAVEETGNLPIPAHLQDAHYKGAAKLGHGTGYLYSHDYPNHYVEQQYLPYELNGREFYAPSGNGYEVKVKEHMKRLKEEEQKRKKSQQ